DPRRGSPDPHRDLRGGPPPCPDGARSGRPRAARPCPHHRRRARGQRSARSSGRARGAARPVGLADAVDRPADRGARRPRRRRAAGDVQRGSRDDRRRATDRGPGLSRRACPGGDRGDARGRSRPRRRWPSLHRGTAVPMRGRIAVAVSGAGSNLRALHAAADRGDLGGEIVLVLADRPCPALDWAMEQGIDTALVPDGSDDTVAEVLDSARPDAVVLAGYMRIVGPGTLAAYAARILNTHPSLLPAFPGAHAV